MTRWRNGKYRPKTTGAYGEWIGMDLADARARWMVAAWR